MCKRVFCFVSQFSAFFLLSLIACTFELELYFPLRCISFLPFSIIALSCVGPINSHPLGRLVILAVGIILDVLRNYTQLFPAPEIAPLSQHFLRPDRIVNVNIVVVQEKNLTFTKS